MDQIRHIDARPAPRRRRCHRTPWLRRQSSLSAQRPRAPTRSWRRRCRCTSPGPRPPSDPLASPG
eukprot:scaffold2968_cov321-Pinguiococcus_pyrenoidosus.AAC.11